MVEIADMICVVSARTLSANTLVATAIAHKLGKQLSYLREIFVACLLHKLADSAHGRRRMVGHLVRVECTDKRQLGSQRCSRQTRRWSARAKQQHIVGNCGRLCRWHGWFIVVEGLERKNCAIRSSGHIEQASTEMSSGVEKTKNAFLKALQKFCFVGREEKQLCLNIMSAVQSDDGRFSSAEIVVWFVGAAYLGLTNVIKLFLKFNKNLLNAVVSETCSHVWKVRGRTALHSAIWSHHPETVDCLIEAGVDFDAINSAECTAIHLAVQRGAYDIFEKLLAAGADVDRACNMRLTPLWWAAFYEYESVLRRLIAAGANVNIVNYDGRTPLYLATCYGSHSDKNATHLLAAGARIDAQVITTARPQMARLLKRVVEWRRLLDLALMFQPLNLPVLVVQEIFGRLAHYPHNIPSRSRTWNLLKTIKHISR